MFQSPPTSYIPIDGFYLSTLPTLHHCPSMGISWIHPILSHWNCHIYPSSLISPQKTLNHHKSNIIQNLFTKIHALFPPRCSPASCTAWRRWFCGRRSAAPSAARRAEATEGSSRSGPWRRWAVRCHGRGGRQGAGRRRSLKDPVMDGDGVRWIN